MKRYLIFRIIVVLLGVPTWSNASIQESDLLESVLKNHPDLAITGAAVNASIGSRLNAQGLFDPKLIASWIRSPMGNYQFSRYEVKLDQLTPFWGLRVFGGYARSDGVFPIYDTKLLTGSDGEGSLGMELPLLKSRGIDVARNRIQLSELAVLQSDFTRAERLTAVLLESRISYWDWVYAAFKLSAANQTLEFARVRDRALQVRANRGDVAPFDFKDNQRIILSRQLRLNLAEQDLVDKERKFAIFWRNAEGVIQVPKRTEAPAEISAPVKIQIPAADRLDEILENGPQLQALRLDLDRGQEQLALARNSLLPSLNLRVERIREFGTTSLAFKNQNELRATANLEIALPFRQARGEVLKIESEMDGVRAKNLLARQKLKAQFEALLNNYNLLFTNIELASQEQKLAHELADGERRRFAAGHSNLINVNLREEIANDAELRFREIQVIAHQTHARLEAILNPLRPQLQDKE